MRGTTVRAGYLKIVLAASLPFLSAACAAGAARAGQFDRFAEAGIQYADAVPEVLDESFAATVATSSQVLADAREPLSPEDRLEALEQGDSLLSERLRILQDLARHARLLRRYFLALQGLARTDADASGLNDVTGSLVEALGAIGPSLREATFAGNPVSALVEPAVSFGVARFRSAALEAELRRHAVIVEREIALQEAALAALADAWEADREALLTVEHRDRVVLPYVRDRTLPASWADRRLRLFRRRAALSAPGAAAEAAASLRVSFVALVEDRLDASMVNALLDDVSRILSFLGRAAPGGDDEP